MPTAKQIAANRLNAQKSTGPRTTQGKAASRFNSLKHGIFATHQFMFDETPEDLAHLTAEYHELHTPSNPEEHILVGALIHNEWRLRRMRRIEADLWDDANLAVQIKNLVKDFPAPAPCSPGEAFLADSPTFERLQRVVNSCERAYRCASKDLAARAHARLTPQPQHSTTTSAKLASLQQIRNTASNAANPPNSSKKPKEMSQRPPASPLLIQFCW